jgi:hypothetical protein
MPIHGFRQKDTCASYFRSKLEATCMHAHRNLLVTERKILLLLTHSTCTSRGREEAFGLGLKLQQPPFSWHICYLEVDLWMNVAEMHVCWWGHRSMTCYAKGMWQKVPSLLPLCYELGFFHDIYCYEGSKLMCSCKIWQNPSFIIIIIICVMLIQSLLIV